MGSLIQRLEFPFQFLPFRGRQPIQEFFSFIRRHGSHSIQSLILKPWNQQSQAAGDEKAAQEDDV